MNLIADLKARKLIQDIMPGTEEQLAKEVTTGYIGFDPTADSLHVGSLLPITLLMRLQRAGHKPIALVGGATGMIGDPTGKSAERNLLDAATIQRNCDGQKKQLEKFLDFDASKPNAAELVNNYDWLKDYSFLEFIRDIGKHISVNYMLSKDSVQKRLEHGLSFTEFTYQLIQGYDFYYLNQHKGVKLQMGGADQWGNIVTGSELIRRISAAQRAGKMSLAEDHKEQEAGHSAFAFTCPLITKSDGGKFGKTESGTVWLDPAKTSPYAFYQFWLKLPDGDAERMAYTFSFREVPEIEALINEHRQDPGLRTLQKALAEEMTLLVHSADDVTFAQQAAQILFSKNALEQLQGLTEAQFLDVMDGVPQVISKKEILEGDFNLTAFVADNGVFTSRGEAKKGIQNGSLSINKEKILSLDHKIEASNLISGKYLLIQKGKTMTLAIFE